jgi:hypothetical protein
MFELGSSGSVRGVLSNEHPYRHPARPFMPFRQTSRVDLALCEAGHVSRRSMSRTLRCCDAENVRAGHGQKPPGGRQPRSPSESSGRSARIDFFVQPDLQPALPAPIAPRRLVPRDRPVST